MELKHKKRLGLYCKTCPVAKLCLPENVEDNALEAIESIIEHIAVYQPGEHIYLTNRPVKYLYALYEGHTKEYATSYNGNEQVINFYYPGDIMGLDLVTATKHHSSSIALTACRICLIPVEPLKTQAQYYRSILNRLLHITSNKIKNDTIIGPHTNAKLRIAKFLLNSTARSQQRGSSEQNVQFFMSQIDLSNHLGLAFETVSRVLHQFQNQNIIKINNKIIHILNDKALTAYAEPDK